MAVISMKQLLEAGLHFGHQTRRWNPKMKRFIHGERSGIHIVDLHQTLSHLEQSYIFVRDLVADGGTVLFIGTKKQAQDSIQSYAERCNMPYINERWLGGMLTNFQTISKRVSKMKEYQRMRDSGEFEAMPKKEALLINRELTKLQRNLGGIRDMERLPEAIFVLDTKKEHIAVTEARKVGVPIVAVVDTNCDPDLIDYAIPGNDDAIRAGQLMCRVISDAVQEGRFIRSKRVEFDGGGPKRNAFEEAEIAGQQEKARSEAAAQAAIREARLAQAQQSKADEPNEDESNEDEPNEDESNEDEPNEDEPNEDEPNEDEPNEDEPNEDEPNEDELNEDELNEDELNEDELNEDELNEDELNEDELNEDELNEDELNEDELNEDELNEDELNEDELNEDELNEDELNEDEPNEDEPNEDEPNEDINPGQDVDELGEVGEKPDTSTASAQSLPSEKQEDVDIG